MDKKKTHKAIYSFFENIAAIPPEVRKSFLKKILKRKNSSGQKNVKLIKIIYAYIESDKISEWDEERISKRLDITRNMLYWHKSAILNELRKHYFGWEEIEKKEFPVKNTQSSLQSLQFSYRKAKRMFDIGMRREAKNIFLLMARELEDDLTKEKVLVFGCVLDYLIRYYHGCRDRYKFNLYFGKLKKIIDVFSAELSSKNKTALEINFLIAQSLCLTFRAFEDKSYALAVDYLLDAYNKAKQLKDYDKLFYITFFADETCLRLRHKKGKGVKHCIKEAIKISEKSKNEIYLLAFKGVLCCYELETEKSKPGEYYLNTVLQYYNSAKLLPLDSNLTRIKGLLIRVYGALGIESEFIKLTKEIYYANVLESNKFSAWWKLYIFKNMEMEENAYLWKLQKSRFSKTMIPVIDEIEYNSLTKWNELITYALADYKNIFSYFVYSAIYQGIIIAEFFMGKPHNYERALMFIKKLHKIEEKANSLSGGDYAKLIKIGILIVNESRSHRENFIREKYKNILNDEINFYLENENGSNLIDRYAVLSRIAQLSEVKFIWQMTEDFYNKIAQKSPAEVNIFVEKIKANQYSAAS